MVTRADRSARYLRGYDELIHHNLILSQGHPRRLQQRYDLPRGAEPARLDHFNIVVPDPRSRAQARAVRRDPDQELGDQGFGLVGTG
jgi:hypothetical protein